MKQFQSNFNLLQILFPKFSNPFESRFIKHFPQDQSSLPHQLPKKIKSGIMRIDLSNIELGKDNRTSIMIKNLPQFLSYAELTKTLGISEYINYIYIPTMSNSPHKILGFAFVNAIKPLYILNIIKIMQSKKHSFPFILDKHPEICYAKIQGKDALEQTFDKFKTQHTIIKRSIY